MHALTQNLQFTFRHLRRNTAFTVTVVLTLALGIGAHHRDLLARRGRPAAPTSVPGRRPACFVGRSSGRPARHVR